MRAWATPAHRWLLTLTVAAVLVQFFLAGAGAFRATDYDLHTAIGTALMPAAFLALGLAALAGRHVPRTTVLLVLLVVQWVLGTVASEQEPWLGTLHALNALAVGAVAGTTTGRAWQQARTAGAS